MIRAAVFDLDNTLFDSTTVPAEVLAPAVAAARAANVGPDALPPETLESALAAARRFGFLNVADAFRVPAALRAAWHAAYQGLVVSARLAPYADVIPALKALSMTRLLLTTGFRRMQESKIAALGIADLFAAIYIDAMDGGARPGKRRLLAEILRTHGLAPGEVLVLGDSAENEIAAGNALGTITVQVLRPGITRSDAARHHITSLAELAELIARLERAAARTDP